MTPLTILNADTFILGEGESNAIADRGFSTLTKDVNLTKERGVLYFNETETDRGGATLTGNVIASTYDASFLGNDVYLLDDDGAFYTLNGSTLTKRQTDSTNSYVIGTSEIEQFRGNLYATSTDIARLTGSDLTALDHDWWTNTRSHAALESSYRHPLETVEDTLYIADKNKIHTWDDSTTVYNAMSLPTSVNITSLRRHPDGQHLIAFCGVTANYSHTGGGGGLIYIIDTVNLEWIREIKIEAQIEGSTNVGGVIYVTYGDKLGYFNGDGITYLKTLNSATTYSHNLGSMEDMLLVRDGTDILAYGDLGKGKVFWRIASNRTNSQAINNFIYKGENKLLLAYSDGSGGGLLKEIDYDNAGIYGELVTNKIDFGSKVWIRKIVILHTETNGAGTSAFNVFSLDSEGDSTTIRNVSYSSKTVTETRIDTNIYTDYFQLKITGSNDDIGYRRVVVFYESGE